ncbi:MAG: hypothetical protein HYZ54_09440 [Ignavibacteriae bacterium]|nr:hypothetical protein [Ignavibacteriota bacterium]
MNINSSNPRVLVLGGNQVRWSAKDIPEIKNTMNGVEAWAFTFWGDYRGYGVLKEKEISEYDIVIANTNFKYFPEYLRFRDKLSKGAKWIALIEGSASDYLKPKSIVKQVLDAADVVNCINRHALPLFKAITSSRVEYLGIPYPAAGIRKFEVPFEKRKREVLICPALTSRWNDYFVAKKLGIEYYGFEQLLSRKIKTLWSNYSKHGTFSDKRVLFHKTQKEYEDSNLRIVAMTHLDNVFKITGRSLIWLNLDDRYTWGRNVLDAAALQIPVISTHSTGHAEDFFPELLVSNEFDIDSAIRIGKKLLEDKNFYKSIATIPIEKFDHLSHECMKYKLLSWF